MYSKFYEVDISNIGKYRKIKRKLDSIPYVACSILHDQMCVGANVHAYFMEAISIANDMIKQIKKTNNE